MTSTTDYRSFFPELARNPDNDTFLVFADLLEEAGRDTQAQLIRASLRLRDDLTPSQEAVLGLPAVLDLAARDHLREEHTKAQDKFIKELGPDIAALYQDDRNRITFDRGVIQHLDLSGATISSPMPDNLQVAGRFNLWKADIKCLPNGSQVGESLYLAESRIESLPTGLQVLGDLNLADSQIASLPEGLKVGGDLNLTGIKINQEEAKHIRNMPGLSDQAKISGLRTAGLTATARAFEQRAARGTGTGLPPL